MADSGGHWSTLAEAQKLTQSMKIPGVIEEDIKRENLLLRVPVAQAAHSGLKIEWLRELTTAEDAVADLAIAGQLSWAEDITYEEKEATLKMSYIQRKLDRYVQNIYSTYNDYKARVLLESEKGMIRKLGARFVYGDTTYGGSNQFDGIHALAAEHGAPYTAGSAYDPKNINQGEAALSLTFLRLLSDSMKLGIDEYWMPFEIVRRIDAAYQEAGFAHLSANAGTAGALGYISMGFNELGKRVLFWDASPIVRTDYLVAEEGATGTGSSTDARELLSSGDKQYSIFALSLIHI